jgi:hypothetical protein
MVGVSEQDICSKVRVNGVVDSGCVMAKNPAIPGWVHVVGAKFHCPTIRPFTQWDKFIIFVSALRETSYDSIRVNTRFELCIFVNT